MKKISIVVPMYNEEEMAPLFFEAVDKVISGIQNYEFEIVVTNDGSRDNTLNILQEEYNKRNNLVVVNLSRNFGHEPAVRAGLLNCTGDAAIVMDADLQDPPEVIPALIETWEQGYDVINAKRSSRKNDTSFKRDTAGLYYKVLNKLSGKIKIPQNVANFRLISRRVIDEVNNLPEKERVFRVEVPFVGFNTAEVLFARPSRAKGETKYSLKAMVNLAVQSITVASVAPLRIPAYFGVGFAGLGFISLLTELVFFILKLTNVLFIDSLTMWAWLIISILVLFFGIILGCFGLVGIYLGTVTDEVRNRPNVIVKEVLRK